MKTHRQSATIQLDPQQLMKLWEHFIDATFLKEPSLENMESRVYFQEAAAGQGTVITLEFNDPDHRSASHEDLHRFKQFAETGEIPTSAMRKTKSEPTPPMESEAARIADPQLVPQGGAL
jgi:hypothetical protein